MSAGLGVRALVNVCPEQSSTEQKQSSPRVLLPRAGVHILSLSPGLGLNQEITEAPQIKEEPEEQSVKQEEKQLSVSASEIITICVKEEEFSREDISSELSSDTDKDDDWEPSSCAAAKSTGLFPKSKSAPETSASVNKGHMSGAKVAKRKKLQCSFCNKTFGFKSHLEVHIRIHTGERPYSCLLCEKSFTQKESLRQHMRTHTGGEGKHQCSFCSKKFVTKQNLQRHIRIHTGEKPYSCKVCNKTFTQKSGVTSHMRTHRGENPAISEAERKKHQCSVCSKWFRTNVKLQRHNRVHTGERPYNCTVCSKTFKANDDLKKHMRTHTGERPFSCLLCTKAFTQKSILNTHMKTHRDIRFNCSICEMDFTDSSSLKEHLKIHTEEKPFSCSGSLFEKRTVESEEELCGSKEENQRKQQLLDSAHGLRVLLPRAGVPSLSPGPGLNQETTESPQIKEEPEEQSVKQEEEQLPVAVCLKKEESSLLQQKQTESAPKTSAFVNNGHKSGAEGAEEKKYKCSVCNKRFGRKDVLKNHMRVHTGEKPYSCSLCEKSFAHKNRLDSHRKTHNGDDGIVKKRTISEPKGAKEAARKKHRCSVCNKRFVTKQNLRTHSRVHTGEKPYSCPVCKKTFTQKCHLTAHIRTHPGENYRPLSEAERRKHQCSVCNKWFRTKAKLQIHDRVHTGERPYSCTVCKKTFKSEEVFKRHMRIHTGERPYGCLFCTKSFARKAYLDSHMITHRYITFNCSICEMNFTGFFFLKEHLKTHAEEKPSSCLGSLFERRTAESEENQRKQQLLDSARGLRVLLPRAGVPLLSPGPGLKQEITETPQIKEEPEEQSVKQEEEQLPVCVPEPSAVCVKREESSLLQQRQSEHREETQGEDISSEPHFHSETEGHTELSSDTDNDDHWDPLGFTAAKSTGLFPKYKSAPETSASVNNGHKSGAEGAEGKKHQCSVCNKRFGRKQILKNHIRIHTGEKPYSCTVCTKSFNQKSNLKTHMKTHRAEGNTEGAEEAPVLCEKRDL